jgi:hypothetical protein
MDSSGKSGRLAKDCTADSIEDKCQIGNGVYDGEYTHDRSGRTTWQPGD